MHLFYEFNAQEEFKIFIMFDLDQCRLFTLSYRMDRGFS